MERLYLLGTLASVCGTGSMDLLVDQPFWPALLCALFAMLMMRLLLQRVPGFVPAPGEASQTR